MISRRKLCAKFFTTVTRYLRKFCRKDQRLRLMQLYCLEYVYMVLVSLLSDGGGTVQQEHTYVGSQPANRERETVL